MKILFIITSDDGETIYNAMRLANVGVDKSDEVSVLWQEIYNGNHNKALSG